LLRRSPSYREDVTILVGVNTVLMGAVMLADTRLSNPGPHGQILLRDACQKMVTATPWSIVAVAGALCPARYLLKGVVTRLRSYPEEPGEWLHDDSLTWLRDDDALRAFIYEGLSRHAARTHHLDCAHQPVAVMIGWVDYAAAQIDGRCPPQILCVRTPALDVRRVAGFGAEVAGSGEVIAPAFDLDLVLKIANMGKDQAWARANQCMFVAEVVRAELRKHAVTSVGGLFQVAHLFHGGVQTVPYWYWVDVEPGYGTYVAMRVEEGMWVQDHRPSGMAIRVASPFDFDVTGPMLTPGQHEVFEPSTFLRKDSKGVLPTPPLVLAYTEYNPDYVPREIQASWGPDPVPPLTGRNGNAWRRGER
jgi:hypothetical protein